MARPVVNQGSFRILPICTNRFLIGQCISNESSIVLWTISNWVSTLPCSSSKLSLLVRSFFRAINCFGLVSLEVISTLLFGEGFTPSKIVTVGRWSLISSIMILLVIFPVSKESTNILSINVALVCVILVGFVITGNRSQS